MIDYIVFPVADIDEEKSAKIYELNLVPRSNVSKDKVLDIRLTTTTTGMNKEVTVNVIDMMKVEVMMEVMATMKKNVCFLCKCLE